MVYAMASGVSDRFRIRHNALVDTLGLVVRSLLMAYGGVPSGSPLHGFVLGRGENVASRTATGAMADDVANRSGRHLGTGGLLAQRNRFARPDMP